MNRFYKAYDDITASEPFKQRMVRTLQSETRGETATRSLRLPIRRRTLAILIAAAVIPAWFLLRYIRQMDRLEQEPPALIRKLVILGLCSTLLAALSRVARPT